MSGADPNDGGSTPQQPPQQYVGVLTRTRRAATPYLPPPVVRAVRAVDEHPFLRSLGTDEPTMALLTTLALAYALYRLIGTVGAWIGAGSKRAKLYEDGSDDVLGGVVVGGGASTGRGRLYGDTVVLCGPSGGGKTALLHALCHPSDGGGNGMSAPHPPATLTSLRANAALLDGGATSPSAPGGGCLPVRAIDYPGHPALSSRLLPLLATDANRVVLVLDSTRPVAEGAELLYSILTDGRVREAWSPLAGDNGRIPILVACAKGDVKGAKNWRRVKIQVRTELERLRKVHALSKSSPGEVDAAQTDMAPSSLPLGVPGKNLDLDDLGPDVPISLSFVSVGRSTDREGMEDLRGFVLRSASNAPIA